MAGSGHYHIDESFNNHDLSKREAEIASLMLQGLTNIEIANRLYIEETTVKKHVSKILDKYKVNRRAEFVAKIFTNSEGQSTYFWNKNTRL
jgi:DNA-binding NarL/FixJ family response regulator